MQTHAPEKAEELGEAYSKLTERCLAEVLVCQQSTAAKAYIAALVKTAAGLSLEGINTIDASRLKSLAGQQQDPCKKPKSKQNTSQISIICISS